MIRFFWGIFLVGFVLCEARVVSFEAVSSVSAEDADRQALSGIAFQIQARVNASHQTIKSEVSGKGQSELHTNYSEQINVQSDVMLNGVDFHREKLSDGRWKSTAVFDTEKATENSRRELRQIQKDALELKGKMESFVAQQRFDDALQTLESLELLQGKFKKIYDRIAIFESLDESFRFGVDISRLTDGLAEAIKDLKISFAGQGESSVPRLNDSISVLVKNSQGAVKNLAVTASIDGKNVWTAKTDSMGIASFFLDVEKLIPGNHEIVFQIRCPKFNRENSNLELRINYFSKNQVCAVSFVCSENAEICAIGKELLLKAGFQSKKNAENIRLRMNSEKRDVFEGNSQQVVREEFLVEFVGNSATFSKRIRGTGASELRAQKNAIQKIRPEEIRTALLPLCKGQKK